MREVVSSVEVYSESDYLYIKLLYKEHGALFIAQSPSRTYDLDALQGKRVPVESQHVSLPADLDSPTAAPFPLPADSYVKGVDFIRYDHDKPNTEPLGQALIDETRVYEDLRHHPHPNICQYRGYIADETDRVTGLCLQKYQYMLAIAVWKKVDIDWDVVMKDYKSAIDHLHSLGWIHNDISSGNLMIDYNLRGGIIDFGGSTREGASIDIETPFWTRGSRVAEKENDYYGLRRAELFIHDGGGGPNWSGFTKS